MKRLVLMLCVLGIAIAACGGTKKTVTLVHPTSDVVSMWAEDAPPNEDVWPAYEIPVGTRCEVLGEFTYTDAIGKIFFYKLDCSGVIGHVMKDFCK